MRIVIDGYPLAELKTGVGHYTFELSRHLALIAPDDEFSLISPRPFDSAALDGLQSKTTRLRLIEKRTSIFTRRWWSIGLPRYLRAERAQLFHGTNYQIPLFGSCPAIVTIHDLSILLHPEMHERKAISRGRLLLPRFASRARLIITPTESIRGEVIEHLRVAPYKVIVVPEAPRECFRAMPAGEAAEVRRHLGVADDFLLSVATIEPRKNLARLLDAFEEMLRGRIVPPPQLVLVGREGWLSSDLVKRIERLAFTPHLRWLGYVADRDLTALYSSCRLFVYPSLYEGFGLPPLEAMACGAPVIASRIASVAEVTNGAARLVVPDATQALVQTLTALWHDADAREQLSARGAARAKEFTWQRTAELTREVYRRALANPYDQRA